MKVAIIRNTEGEAVGLWWHYNEERKGIIELTKDYESLLTSAFDDPAALNVEAVKATFEPEVLQAMISHPAPFVSLVEIDQRLPVVSHD